ncbi:MAG: TlpA disulfide reductase family protein [Actinomycetota bacterium]
MSTSVGAPSTGPELEAPEELPARRRLGRTALVVAAIVAAVGIAAYATRPTTDPREEGGVAVIDEAFPGLRGEAVVGPPVDTAAMAWSVLVVNVWASWCLACRREQPALQQVQAAYVDRGVELVGVNYRDQRAAAERWIEEFDVTYPSMYDPEGRTAASLGFPFVPDTYLIDASGATRYAIYGETSVQELSGLIDELLSDPANAVDAQGA